MATLTIRLTDEKHARLRQLAERRRISVNKLIDELSTAALAEFDAEIRFRARAALGSPEDALRLLEDLDRREAASTLTYGKRRLSRSLPRGLASFSDGPGKTTAARKVLGQPGEDVAKLSRLPAAWTNLRRLGQFSSGLAISPAA
jgi:hypothetical protein